MRGELIDVLKRGDNGGNEISLLQYCYGSKNVYKDIITLENNKFKITRWMYRGKKLAIQEFRYKKIEYIVMEPPDCGDCNNIINICLTLDEKDGRPLFGDEIWIEGRKHFISWIESFLNNNGINRISDKCHYLAGDMAFTPEVYFDKRIPIENIKIEGNILKIKSAITLSGKKEYYDVVMEIDNDIKVFIFVAFRNGKWIYRYIQNCENIYYGIDPDFNSNTETMCIYPFSTDAGGKYGMEFSMGGEKEQIDILEKFLMKCKKYKRDDRGCFF